MATLATMPRQVYAAGTYTIPAQAIPDSVTKLTALAQRNAWPDTGGDVIKVSLDFSYDGGATWPEQGWGFTAPGGVLTYKGQTLTASSIEPPIKPGTNRRVRGTVILFAALDTSIVIDGS